MPISLSVILIITASFFWLNTAQATGISYDNDGLLVAFNQGSSFSGAYTASVTSGGIIFVGISGNVLNIVTAVTYAGISLTEIASANHGKAVSLWYAAIGSVTGSNTLTTTTVGGTNYDILAATFSGANQTGIPDAFSTDTTSSAASGAAGPYSTTVTTNVDNDFAISIAGNPAWNSSPGSGTTVAAVDNSGQAAILFLTSSAVTPAGTATLNVTTGFSGGSLIAAVTASFSPISSGGVTPTPHAQVNALGKENWNGKINFY